MKKYEACAAIVEISNHVQGVLASEREALQRDGEALEHIPPDQRKSLAEYLKRQVVKLERWLQALEMAGNALTK